MIKNGRRTNEDLANYETVTVSAGDTYTDPISVFTKGDFSSSARVNISIRPTSASLTVTVQRQYNEEAVSVWHDVDKYVLVSSSEDTEDISVSPEPEKVKYRMGCKVDDFTSGSCVLRIGSY